jgi:SAM-dependent methyltransferase
MLVSEGPDVERAAPSRVYDGLLLGSHTFAVDREMAQELLAVQPEVTYWAWANRLFVGRAVRFVLGAGVRQVLDIGCGLPTTDGNLHDIAWKVAPDARIVYVDIDPVVVADAQRVRAGRVGLTAALGDLRDPDAILRDPEVIAGLDWSQPVVVVLGAVLHFVAESDDPAAILERLRQAVAPGSYLVVSHACEPADISPQEKEVARAYSTRTAPLTLRSPSEGVRLLGGWELIDPGVTGVAFWRPDPGEPEDVDRAGRIPGWVAVARRGHQLLPVGGAFSG